MSALPRKADMCSALAYVCFGPKADMCSARVHFCLGSEAKEQKDRREAVSPKIHRCFDTLKLARSAAPTLQVSRSAASTLQV
jgi:hypothetical protein